jgi:hypothetical protein
MATKCQLIDVIQNGGIWPEYDLIKCNHDICKNNDEEEINRIMNLIFEYVDKNTFMLMSFINDDDRLKKYDHAANLYRRMLLKKCLRQLEHVTSEDEGISSD